MIKHLILGALKGASIVDLAWLARGDELLSHLYLVDGPPFTAVLASSDEGRQISVPWFIALALGSYSRKHCFIRGRGLNRKEAVTCVKHTTAKIKWAMHFATKDESEEREAPLLARPLCPFEGRAEPETNGFVAAVRNCIFGEFRDESRRISRFKLGSNCACFVSLTGRWLKQQGLEAVLSDKDGVFVITGAATLRALVMAKLKPSHYTEVGLESVGLVLSNIKTAVECYASNLAKLGHKKWAYDVVAAVPLINVATLVNTIRCTIKTHKPQGLVEARLLHAAKSGRGGLKSISMVLHKWLIARVEAWPHVCCRSGCSSSTCEKGLTFGLHLGQNRCEIFSYGRGSKFVDLRGLAAVATGAAWFGRSYVAYGVVAPLCTV